jgi:hypothetical protein
LPLRSAASLAITNFKHSNLKASSLFPLIMEFFSSILGRI